MLITDRLRARARRLLRPSGPPPRPSRRGRVFDVVLAVGLGVVAISPSYGVLPGPTTRSPAIGAPGWP